MSGEGYMSRGQICPTFVLYIGFDTPVRLRQRIIGSYDRQMAFLQKLTEE